ncbi:hypothetical protein [Leptolyngbya sp. FACHB-8]|uniref:hypothetical protein n=1 Tax=unclassified Leptolyngbya TaxID=2650499 RepID=UPI001688995D|nr:hypothetical protein [Leptolyngbya sp. FACHB-8]MBD1909756.1 hypothetical protein [Leptolyngbya sp. FACHB-8]
MAPKRFPFPSLAQRFYFAGQRSLAQQRSPLGNHRPLGWASQSTPPVSLPFQMPLGGQSEALPTYFSQPNFRPWAEKGVPDGNGWRSQTRFQAPEKTNSSHTARPPETTPPSETSTAHLSTASSEPSTSPTYLGSEHETEPLDSSEPQAVQTQAEPTTSLGLERTTPEAPPTKPSAIQTQAEPTASPALERTTPEASLTGLSPQNTSHSSEVQRPQIQPQLDHAEAPADVSEAPQKNTRSSTESALSAELLATLQRQPETQNVEAEQSFSSSNTKLSPRNQGEPGTHVAKTNQAIPEIQPRIEENAEKNLLQKSSTNTQSKEKAQVTSQLSDPVTVDVGQRSPQTPTPTIQTKPSFPELPRSDTAHQPPRAASPSTHPDTPSPSFDVAGNNTKSTLPLPTIQRRVVAPEEKENRQSIDPSIPVKGDRSTASSITPNQTTQAEATGEITQSSTLPLISPQREHPHSILLKPLGFTHSLAKTNEVAALDSTRAPDSLHSSFDSASSEYSPTTSIQRKSNHSHPEYFDRSTSTTSVNLESQSSIDLSHQSSQTSEQNSSAIIHHSAIFSIQRRITSSNSQAQLPSQSIPKTWSDISELLHHNSSIYDAADPVHHLMASDDFDKSLEKTSETIGKETPTKPDESTGSNPTDYGKDQEQRRSDRKSSSKENRPLSRQSLEQELEQLIYPVSYLLEQHWHLEAERQFNLRTGIPFWSSDRLWNGFLSELPSSNSHHATTVLEPPIPGSPLYTKLQCLSDRVKGLVQEKWEVERERNGLYTMDRSF